MIWRKCSKCSTSVARSVALKNKGLIIYKLLIYIYLTTIITYISTSVASVAHPPAFLGNLSKYVGFCGILGCFSLFLLKTLLHLLHFGKKSIFSRGYWARSVARSVASVESVAKSATVGGFCV